MDPNARRLKKQWLADQKAAARMEFPLPDTQLQELFRDVDAAVTSAGCDHSLRFTEQWLSDQDVDAQAVVEWLQDNGGHCDCEVVANAADHFRSNSE
jgi:hypothetical protein